MRPHPALSGVLAGAFQTDKLFLEDIVNRGGVERRPSFYAGRREPPQHLSTDRPLARPGTQRFEPRTSTIKIEQIEYNECQQI